MKLECHGTGLRGLCVGESALFRLMFGPEIPDKASYTELRAAAEEAFAVLTREVSRGQVTGTQAFDRAVAAWSLVHGLATLLIDGQIRPEGAQPGSVDAAMLMRRFGRFLDVS